RKVILSYGLWQQRYAGSSNIIGHDIRLNGRLFTIVGVMPAGFNFPEAVSAPEARFWIPVAFNAQQKQTRLNDNWYNVGRLKPGATVAQAQQQVNALNAANLDRVIRRSCPQLYPQNSRCSEGRSHDHHPTRRQPQ